MSDDVINERSTAIVTLSFKDEDGVNAIPTSGVYRLTDLRSGTTIRNWTALPSLAASVEITLTQSDTRILTSTNDYEERLITVFWKYSTTKHGSDDYRVRIRNMHNITAAFATASASPSISPSAGP